MRLWSTWPSCFRMLVARPGAKGVPSVRLLRLVKFLASSMFGVDLSKSVELGACLLAIATKLQRGSGPKGGSRGLGRTSSRCSAAAAGEGTGQGECDDDAMKQGR